MVPNSVTSIGVWAFAECGSLASVTLGDGVEIIGDLTFEACPNLTGLYFQGNAPSFASGVFLEAPNVTVYYLPGTTGWGPTWSGRPAVLWGRPEPVLLTRDSRFGLQTNGFGLVISWATNATVAVEASPTLTDLDWVRVASLPLVNGVVSFADPEWTYHPTRFYRVRKQ